MKKTFVKIALFTAFLLPFQAAFSQSHSQDGLYMGADATYDITRFNHYEVDTLTDLITTDVKSIYNDEGAAVGIFIGYRMSDGPYTVAVEGRYGYSFIGNEIAPNDTYKNTNEFGASILPGYWLAKEVVLFGRLGFSQLKTIRVLEGIYNGSSDTGFHLGAGLQFFISDTISLRGEYNRATYKHKMSQIIDVTKLVNNVLTTTSTQVDFRNKFRRDRFQFSIVTKF